MKERPAPTARLSLQLRRGWPGRAFLLTAAAWLLSACTTTATQVPDLSPLPADMTVVTAPDTSPSCGKIVICTVQCGLGKLDCDTQCATGANPTEAKKAGALALCAVLHCAGSDAGTGLPAILGCLLTSCQSEVANCDGLF